MHGNRAPVLTFISLRVRGAHAYARFRVCDDSYGKITILERDIKSGVSAYNRRFAVLISASCGAFTSTR